VIQRRYENNLIINKRILSSSNKRKIFGILFLGSLLSITLLVIFEIQTTNASPAVINPSAATNTNVTKLVESEGIVPLIPQTVPEIVRVGDRFNLAAAGFNYSPHTVQIPDGGCIPTGLSATFDKNVVVNPSGIQFPLCHQDILTPAKTIPVIAGWPSENYTATAPGITNATLHLVYRIQNDDNSTSLHQYDTPFQFVIVPRT
jgi:hypothetical protein